MKPLDLAVSTLVLWRFAGALGPEVRMDAKTWLGAHYAYIVCRGDATLTKRGAEVVQYAHSELAKAAHIRGLDINFERIPIGRR